jgi:hypothetical protein
MKFHEYVQLREGAGDHIFADEATVFHHRDKARGNPFTLEIPETEEISDITKQK